MAVVDITTNTDYDLAGRFHWHSPAEVKVKTFDGAREAGLWLADSHTIISIPIGKALLRCWYYVTTTFAGGTSIQFKISDSAALTSAITVANNGLDKGTGGFIGHLPDDDVVGHADIWAHTTAQTLDVVVAGTMTAGAMVVGAELIDIAALVDQQ